MIRLKQILKEFPETSSAADITEKELKTAKIVVNGLINRGFSRIGAVGLAGNISVESRFKTSATDGNKAEGLCQWQAARLKALKAFADAKGKGYTSLSLQLDFMKYELLDSYYTNDKYIPGVPKSLIFIDHGDEIGYSKKKPRRDVESVITETKNYINSITSNVSETTKNLRKNVFRPTASLAHEDRRVANALKINDYTK